MTAREAADILWQLIQLLPLWTLGTRWGDACEVGAAALEREADAEGVAPFALDSYESGYGVYIAAIDTEDEGVDAVAGTQAEADRALARRLRATANLLDPRPEGR